MGSKEVSNQNVGNAGEYYIASVLSAHNFVATVTLGRAEDYDLLVVNPKGKPLKVSVKTTLKGVSCLLSERAERVFADDFFYVFIRLRNIKEEAPDFWVVPSKVVSETLSTGHKKWLDTPGKNGAKHNNTPMRQLFFGNHKAMPDKWDEEMKKYYKNIDCLK